MSHPFLHFRTITHHRHQVMIHCFKAGIGWQGLFHDLSKYCPTEFFEGARYYQGTRSPNEKAREVQGYSKAWLHHKGRNKHHFEYWVDLNPATHRYEPVEMPLRFAKEMFCDRVAASKTYQGKNYTQRSGYEYFVKCRARDKMHPATADLLESWLHMLAEQGEKKTFAYLRKLK